MKYFSISGTFEVFFSAFIEDVAGYYYPFIPHVLGYWSRREEEKANTARGRAIKRNIW